MAFLMILFWSVDNPIGHLIWVYLVQIKDFIEEL